MKKLLIITTIVLFSCNNNLDEQANKEFYFSPTATEDVEHEMTPSGNYVDLQIKMHSAYTLLKAFNSGAINEEEYERLKKDLLVKCFKL